MKTLPKFLVASLFMFIISSCGIEEPNNELQEPACGTEESVRWFVNSETHALEFDDIHVAFADARMLYISASPSVDAPETGFKLQYDFVNESADYIALGFTDAEELSSDTWLFSRGSDLDVTLTSFSSVGELICIEFDNGEFSGDLKVRLDKIVESATVKGRVWEDANENGIMEANESPLANVELSLQTDWDNPQLEFPCSNPVYYPNIGATTDVNGEFTFSGVFVDHPTRVSFITSDQSILSDHSQGNTSSVDSDFYLYREITDRKFYHTDVFFMNEGEIKSDIGLGIIELQ